MGLGKMYAFSMAFGINFVVSLVYLLARVHSGMPTGEAVGKFVVAVILGTAICFVANLAILKFMK